MYKTIAKPTESLHKVKGSKHFGYAFRVRNAEEIEAALETLRKTHHAARHHCYAWYLAEDNYRVNDAGEPANSAGAPILGQIRAFELSQVLVVVVRYFGGTKLGVGGLIQAYKTAARMALEAAKIISIGQRRLYRTTCSYEQLSEVLQTARTAGVEVADQHFELTCTLTLAVPEESNVDLNEVFAPLPWLNVEYIGTDEYEL